MYASHTVPVRFICVIYNINLLKVTSSSVKILGSLQMIIPSAQS